MLNIRLARLPEDYADISRVWRGDWEGAPGPDELAYEDADRDPQFYFVRMVAELEDTIVGMAEIGHDTWAHRAGKFKFSIWVLPERWGQGIGKALYQAMLDLLAPLQPMELHVDGWATHPRTVRFLQERGFVERWRRVDQTLDVTDLGVSRPPDHITTDASLIRLKTYPELAQDPQRDEKLYHLNHAVWEDVPVENDTLRNRPLAQFVHDDLNHPNFLQDACFVAVNESGDRGSGDPGSGDYVGFTFHRNEDGELNIEITGVLRAYRRRGIGVWLKQHAIHYAKTHGYKSISTVNDPSNTGMLALNQKLGFKVTGANIRFVKTL